MDNYDIIIAGAGIVGLATGLNLIRKKPKVKLLILEKEDGPAKHQSGHNSGVIHSGIYYKPGSLKALNCIKGYMQLVEFCDNYEIPYKICGKVIVAVNEKEKGYLYNLYERGVANGLKNIRKITKDKLQEVEPHAFGIEAIQVPYTGIIDFKVVSQKYADLILNAEQEINFNEKVIDLKQESQGLKVITDKCTYSSRIFVNCCGLYSDEVSGLNNSQNSIRIIPFRGEYYKLKNERNYFVNSLIYPVPNPEFPFLGVHFTRTIYNEVEAGPNAVLSFKKEGYNKTSFSFRDSMKIFSWRGFQKVALKYYKIGMGEFYRSFNKKAFVKALQRLLPEIVEEDLEPGGSGVRAQAIAKDGKLVDDFVILQHGRIINVLNAPSPAATSSLSIGDTISDKILSM